NFDRLCELPGGRCGERAMGPRPQLASKARTYKFGDHADVFLRQTEHLRENASGVENGLRGLVKRQFRVLPNRRGGVQLKGVVRLGRCDIRLVEFDWCTRESSLWVAALALQARSGRHCGGNDVGLIVG